MSDYWNRFAQSRISRRRVLATGSLTGLGAVAAATVGCGGSDDNDDEADATPTTSGGAGTSVAASPTLAPKRGGTLRVSNTSEPPSLDPFVYITQHAQVPASLWYSRLYKFKSGPDISPRQYVVEGEVAASLPEVTEGGLKLVVKLRDGVKFHDKAPVNGRAVTSEDFKFTLERFRAVSVRKSTVDIVDKLETPDPKTLIFTLKRPSASFLSTLADGSFLHIVPQEIVNPSDKTAGNPIGSGPWVFDSYQTNASLKASANPSYFRGAPYIDKLEFLIIPEASASTAAFRSGQLDILRPVPLTEVKSVSQMAGTKVIEWPGGSLVSMNFDMTGIFQDVRVRRAASMAIDRDGINEAIYEKKGKPSTIFAPGFDPWFLDPSVKENYGDSWKWMQYDPKESARLLKEAAYDNRSVKLGSSAQVGMESIELLAALLKEGGFNIAIDLKEYAAFLETTNKGKIDGGIGYVPYAHYPDPSSFLDIYWNPSSVNLKTPYKDDEVGNLIAQQDQEFDVKKRAEIIHKIQRIFADKMYTVPLVNGPTAIAVSSKLKNYHHIDNVYGVEGFASAFLES